MAAPHVAGAAALLRQLHPEWSVAQVKAALVATARPVSLAEGGEAPPTRAGGRLVDLAAAADPQVARLADGRLLRASSRAGTTLVETVELEDAGGGAGTWNVAVVDRRPPPAPPP